jgi:putative flippase GtrA
MNSVAREAVRYLLASGCALFVDVGLLWVLVQYYSWWYLAAATTSFLSGIAVVYVLSVTLVFNHRRLSDRRVEFLSFSAIGGAGLAINAAVMLVAVKFFGVYYMVAKCIAAGFTFAFNFFARRQLLFVQSRNYDLRR